MELTLDLFQDIATKIAVSPPTQEKSRADDTSSYSDLTRWIIHPYCLRDARTTRLTTVAISFLGLNPIQEEELKTQIFKVADKYSEGEWQRVKDILLISKFTPYRALEEHLKDRSPEDFFGNDLNRIRNLLHRGLRIENSYIPKKSKINKPKRKRGYDDYGHLPKSSWGEGNTTRMIARPEKEREVIPITNTTFFDQIDPAYNKDQGALVEEYTSRNLSSPKKERLRLNGE